jgi:hypothetical protein
MLKLKYVLFSLLVAISFTSCGGDDDVVDEQETTDENGNPDPDGENDPTRTLNCPENREITYELIGDELHLSWEPCFWSDGSELVYDIYTNYTYWDCDADLYGGGVTYIEFGLENLSFGNYWNCI